MAKKKKNQGFVKWFDAKKGYGFISVGDREDIFVHFSNIEMDGFKKLDIGDEVEFEIKDSNNGKGPEALNVKVVSKDRRY
ncbi:MAG: cold shock domain-containing protein [Promethearchaeota archaeon]|nr:MAG: cold shock domain-containing protein [Candidatus Lokiarchaeota archaeon]